MTTRPLEQYLSMFGVPIRHYSTYDFGRERDEQTISVVIPEAEARAQLLDVRTLLPEGYVAFIGTTRWFGDEQHDGVELVVAPAVSKLDILYIARTDAANYDMNTEDLIVKFRELDSRYGIDIIHAETDTIEITLNRMPNDVATFAEEMYAFCPDMVDQGVGSVENLTHAIEASGYLYFWWD